MTTEEVILEFGQWLADDHTRLTRLADAVEDDDPDAFRELAAEYARLAAEEAADG